VLSKSKTPSEDSNFANNKVRKGGTPLLCVGPDPFHLPQPSTSPTHVRRSIKNHSPRANVDKIGKAEGEGRKRS
jgi:hypothetical protein